MKALSKLIATQRQYRQSSKISAEALERAARNRLFRITPADGSKRKRCETRRSR